MSEISVNNEWVDELMHLACKLGLHTEVFEGSLNDNYIFYDTKKIKISGIKPTEYLIIKEVYLNEWSSSLELIPTNDLELVQKYEVMFDPYGDCDN